MWVSKDYLELFNPFHDKLGRFATKQGGSTTNVSGGAKSWMDKPVATIGGKTVTRKHVAIAAGVVAAAAVAATGAVVIAKSGKLPTGIAKKHPKPVIISSKDPYHTNLANDLYKENERKISGVQDTLDKFDADRDIAYPGKRSQIFYSSPDDFVKAAGVDDAVAICDDLGNTHFSPEVLVAEHGWLEKTVMHEELHARTRIGYGMKSLKQGGPPLFKGAEEFNANSMWLEEGLTESLSAVLTKTPNLIVDEYVDYVSVVTYGVSKATRSTSGVEQYNVAFDVLSDLHKYNGSNRSIAAYIRDLPNVLKSRGYSSGDPSVLHRLFVPSDLQGGESIYEQC